MVFPRPAGPWLAFCRRFLKGRSGLGKRIFWTPFVLQGHGVSPSGRAVSLWAQQQQQQQQLAAAAVSATSCWLAASCCTAAIALTATDAAAAAAAVPPAAPAVCPAECATKSCNGSSSGSSKPTAASTNQQALKKWKKRIFPPTPATSPSFTAMVFSHLGTSSSSKSLCRSRRKR